MTKEGLKELNKILENHKHWLKRDCAGWENMRADLSGVNLKGAYLTGVNLSNADLERTDLEGVNLGGANLRNANLKGANLRNASLSNANLINADLTGANLRGAILTSAMLKYADLIGADLKVADLRGADLEDADLTGANLIGTDLRNANLSGTDLGGTEGHLIEFRKGKILTDKMIGFKKCRDGVIVTLEIPRGAIVFSINGRKCRTNRAKVIAIEGADRAISQYKYMSYYVGDEFNMYDFNCEYNEECGAGIHFFTTKIEAIKYIC